VKDYYATLGIAKGASQADIKKAYKKLVKKYHPDKTDSPEAHEKFKEVSEAYSVLGDEQKRAEYLQALMTCSPFLAGSEGDPPQPNKGHNRFDLKSPLMLY
jgi:DnaJ-class molecular chaperone